MSRIRNHLIASFALLGAVTASGAASAQSAIIALVGDNTIALINPSSMKVTSSMAAKGVKKLHGIDVRPADGMLYGVATDGNSPRNLLDGPGYRVVDLALSRDFRLPGLGSYLQTAANAGNVPAVLAARELISRGRAY